MDKDKKRMIFIGARQAPLASTMLAESHVSYDDKCWDINNNGTPFSSDIGRDAYILQKAWEKIGMVRETDVRVLVFHSLAVIDGQMVPTSTNHGMLTDILRQLNGHTYEYVAGLLLAHIDGEGTAREVSRAFIPIHISVRSMSEEEIRQFVADIPEPEIAANGPCRTPMMSRFSQLILQVESDQNLFRTFLRENFRKMGIVS